MKGYKCWCCPAEQPDDDVLCADCRRELEDSLSQLIVSREAEIRVYNSLIKQAASRDVSPSTGPLVKEVPKHE